MTAVKALRGALLAGVIALAGLPALGFVGLEIGSAAAADRSTAVQAIESALRGDFIGAGALASRSGDQAAVHLVEFLYLKDHWKDAGHDRIVAFLKDAPKWPLTETLRKRAEHQLYSDNHSAAEIQAYFGGAKPATAEGELALARAAFATGNVAKGKSFLQDAWLSPELDAAAEKQVLSEFGKYLDDTDRRKRVWALVMHQESNAAIRNAKRIGGPIVTAAETAQLLLRFVAGADKKYAALPAAARENAAIKYALARFHRKNERYLKARDVLASLPATRSGMIVPEAAWTERRIVARRLLGPGNKDKHRSAYQIASRHGLTSGDDAVDAEFLSGWIALRQLNDAATAKRHFEKIIAIAPSRTEKARGHYWLGRALGADRNETGAAAEYKRAAQYSTVYHGQLAREEIGLGTVAQKIASGAPSDAARKRIEQDDVVRAFRLLKSAGGKTQLNLFLWSLASRFDSADEMNAVADMIHDTGGTPMALRFAKAAGKRGIDIDSWAYPIRGLPDWRQIGKPVEKSLVFALSRQESEFDTNAGSKAGAQGLMQLMPGTARIVANQHRLPFAPTKLKSDPVYNVKLGSAHLADLVADYNGSYILTLVAYNAGPRRVTEWIEAYGDPRSSKIDPIDWVESIPFHETRQYVQKVMQNVHVYRSRLAPKSVAPMSADLRRGSPTKLTDLLTGSVSPASCAANSKTKCD